jgi:hypothetical protein
MSDMFQLSRLAQPHISVLMRANLSSCAPNSTLLTLEMIRKNSMTKKPTKDNVSINGQIDKLSKFLT